MIQRINICNSLLVPYYYKLVYCAYSIKIVHFPLQIFFPTFLFRYMRCIGNVCQWILASRGYIKFISVRAGRVPYSVDANHVQNSGLYSLPWWMYLNCRNIIFHRRIEVYGFLTAFSLVNLINEIDYVPFCNYISNVCSEINQLTNKLLVCP